MCVPAGLWCRLLKIPVNWVVTGEERMPLQLEHTCSTADTTVAGTSFLGRNHLQASIILEGHYNNLWLCEIEATRSFALKIKLDNGWINLIQMLSKVLQKFSSGIICLWYRIKSLRFNSAHNVNKY